MWSTASRASMPAPTKAPKSKLTLTTEQRQTQREERTFRDGQRAAATLIRALSVPDRTVQLAIAKVLIDAGKRVSMVIAQDGIVAYEQERWTPGNPEAQALPNLRRWYEGPDALGAESQPHDLAIALPG